MARLSGPGTEVGVDTPTTIAYGDAAAIGSSGTAAAGNHVHGAPTDPLGPAVFKTADQNKTTDTTLVIDADLQQEVLADRRYRFTLTLETLIHGTPDIKWAWTLPSGASGWAGFEAYAGADNYARDITTASQTMNGGAIGDIHVMEGTLITAGAGGTFGWQWAQNVSASEDCIVREGSSLVLIDGGAT